MSRPLLAKSVFELEQAVRRNQHHEAELGLIETELRHRSSQAARALLAQVRSHLSDLEKTGLEQLGPGGARPNTASAAPAMKRGRPPLSIEELSERVQDAWGDPGKLRQLRPTLERRAGNNAADELLVRVDARLGSLGARKGRANGGGTVSSQDSPDRLPAATASTPQQSRSDHLPPKPEPQPMTEERRWTEEAVADLRKKLVDLSKRSPLIAFKHGGRGASHLRIVDERPDLLFDALAEDAMGFEPLPGEDDTPKDEQTPAFRIAYERARLIDDDFLAATDKLGDDERDARAWQEAERALRAKVRQQLNLPPLDYGKALDVNALARAHGFDPSYDLKPSDGDDVAAHHEDDRIRVLLIRKELEKRLKSIWERYHSHARETGLHTLFLVFGFVQWFEDDNSDVALYAPLLLLAVQLDRKIVRGRYEYTLRGHDDGLQVNVALAEKMRQHFGLELPSLREEETPESYFIRVGAILEKGRRLSLRRFATLAVLPFPRMVLWKDLDPAAWADGAFASHDLLPGLVGAKDVGGASMAETFDIDAAPWADKAPPLIQPADASQHSALIDVVEGHSIAIEGPPGTGKSQTITNIIAAALDAGKRVLFVAEKQAALSVVASRLKMMGFGPLLLELHGDTANRADFYDSLRQRLAVTIRPDAEALATARRQLKHQRDLLRRYLALIGTSLGALGRTAYWLAWREINLRRQVDRTAAEYLATRWKPQQPAKIDRTTLAFHRSEIGNFSEALAAIDKVRRGDHRTRWALATRVGAFDQSPQLAAARNAALTADTLAASSQSIEDALTLGLPAPGGPISAAAAQLAELSGFGDVDEAIVRAALRHPDEARALLMQQARWRQLCSKLEEDVTEPDQIGSSAIATLASALEASSSPPETVTDCHAQLVAATRAVALDKQTIADRQTFQRLLRLDEEMTVDTFAKVAEVIVELGDGSATVLALHDAALLDPLTQLTIEHERGTAETLAAEREAIRQDVKDDAFDLETDDLNHLAGVLAETGMFGRLFGGAFRTAKRRAAAILQNYRGREATADILRYLARHKSRAATFRSESPATALFPELLWRGAESDWQSLDASVVSLKQARDRLAASHCDGVLQTWLGLTSQERVHTAALARQLLPVLADAKTFGLASCPVADLPNMLAREHGRLAALDEALKQVGALPRGLLTRGGSHLAERLATLHATAADFDRLAVGEGFEWTAGIGSSLEPLARALSQSEQMAAMTGPIDFLSALRSSNTPGTAIDGVMRRSDSYAAAVRAWEAASQALVEAAGLTPEAAGNAATDWRSMAAELAELANDEEGARLAADLRRYREALDDIGCAPFALAALEGAAPAGQLADLYELMVIRSLLTDYLGGDGMELARLGGLTLDAARREFVRIDKELHELEAKAIIAKRLSDRGERGRGHGPKRDWTDMSLIESELSLKRPRTPIRDLTLRAGEALQSLKPVWMMSPTSAAQYIRPGSLEFDLLVVDEASQMRPEFAISAIMRGKQFIVVGDANQLPPTDFFATSTDDGDGDGDDTVKVDTESILDLANHRFRRKRRLKWHYRSQHEGLIQFSNRQFYDRDLVAFPSPTTDDDLLGVKCHYIEKAVYEASINQLEAQAVIEEAFRLMRTYPQYSLGIVTMNAKQTELIRNEFDRLILDAAEVRAYVDEYAGGIDEFFIKNLENVQGDERDIILISTVYGPAKDGTVAQRFGPMNRDVGWRRLNVLVTRAKRSTQLFTSLRPNDIKITENSSRGLAAFQAYLTYAHNGAQYEDGSGGAPDSDFEVFVADALRAAGYEVVYQVGVGGFRIDLGVRHADYPIGFIAGIECDGAAYHSGLTVRDRDRIRQTVLEGMGWNIYRIWSTDWFADPHRETAKLLARLDIWRDEFSKEYQARPSPREFHEQTPDDPSTSVLRPGGAEAPLAKAPDVGAELDGLDTPTEAPKEPTGRPMRPLENISWFEVSRGQRYEVWVGEGTGDLVFAGRVEVLSRASVAPQVYGGKLRVARSEYEGWVEATDTYFKGHDIHAAVREVARQARNAANATE